MRPPVAVYLAGFLRPLFAFRFNGVFKAMCRACSAVSGARESRESRFGLGFMASSLGRCCRE